MKRKSRRREATLVAQMILSKRRTADHEPHDMSSALVSNALDEGAKDIYACYPGRVDPPAVARESK